MSMVVDVGLLLLVGVGFEIEEVLLGMEEERRFESIDETSVDGSGMMILVPRWFPFPSTPSSLDAPAEEYTSPRFFGVLLDSGRGASKLA